MLKFIILLFGVTFCMVVNCSPVTEVDDVPQPLSQSQPVTYTLHLVPVPAAGLRSGVLEKLQEDVGNLQLKIEAIETNYSTTTEDQNQRFAELEKRISKCEAIDPRVGALESKILKIDDLQNKVLELENKVSGIDELQNKLATLETKTANLGDELVAIKKSVSNLITDSVTIGRWIIKSENEALVIRDTQAGLDSRYVFPAGGHSDMYTAGTGGTINAERIVFPIRWSIGEESGSYLVFRDRGIPGVDNRYAMSAGVIRDI